MCVTIIHKEKIFIPISVIACCIHKKCIVSFTHQGIAKVGAVDADQYKDFSQKYGVTGFPTIKVFTGSKHNPYQGQRTAEAFVDAAIKAAKEKAYDSLGKKSGGSSSDKVTFLRGLSIFHKLHSKMSHI